MRLVSHRHEFVLYTIPKNACVTLRHLFLYLEEGRLEEFERLDERPRGNNIHVECRRRYGKREPAANYYAFGVVRSPWSRIRSAHAEKIAEKGWLRNVGVRSLSDFIRYLETAGVDSPFCDQHWRAQHTFLGPGEVTLLRVERLQEDVDEMMRRLGQKPVKLPNWKAARSARFNEPFTSSEAEVVGRLYARDAQIAGYECPASSIDAAKDPGRAAFGFRWRCYAHRGIRTAAYLTRRAIGLPTW